MRRSTKQFLFALVPALIAELVLSSVLLAAVPLQAQQPSASPAASPELQEMQQVEDRWDDAIGKHDQYALELVLAPQLVDISASGDVTTRNQQIARLFIKGAEPLGLEQKVISVRVLGEVAVVSGTYVMHWRVGSAPLDEKGIFTHVFQRTRTSWLCINSQRTVVAEDNPRTNRAAAAEEKAKPKSSAELPFHIPLVYKGPASNKPAPAAGANQPPN